MASLQSDLSEFVGLLNSHGVEYLVVGGYAVAFHGHPRFTGDIDLFVRTSSDNARRIQGALEEFGFDGHGLTEAHLVSPDRIVQLGTPPNRVDLLTSITGVEFEDAWASRVPGTLGGHEVNYISLDALLTNKAASGRPTDHADIATLQRVNDRDPRR